MVVGLGPACEGPYMFYSRGVLALSHLAVAAIPAGPVGVGDLQKCNEGKAGRVKNQWIAGRNDAV